MQNSEIIIPDPRGHVLYAPHAPLDIWQVPKYKRPSWAERKRTELIKKLKVNIAKRNKILSTVFKTIFAIIIISIMILFAYFAFLHKANISFQIVIISFILISFSNEFIDSKFETNPEKIKLTR